MSRVLALVAVGAVVATSALAEAPLEIHHTSSKPPFEIVRSMQALQDQVALGSLPAQAALPKLSGRIADSLMAADPDVWRDARNARAAVVYVLSGGQPRVIRKILESGKSPPGDRALMEGALAYVEGRQALAKQKLGNIDARTLATSVGAHLALVQAALVGPKEQRKALRLLDTARLLAPGTLVEEAALRREIVLTEEVDDLDKFIILSSQYVRRFHNSVYAENFQQRFAASILRLGLISDPIQFARLDRLMNEVGLDERLRLYLLVAEAGLVNGKIPVATVAAAKAMTLAKAGSVDAERAQLYAGATQLLSNAYRPGLALVKGVEDGRLPKRDRDLKEVVLVMARQMHEWPQVNAPLDRAPKPAIVAGAGDGPRADASSGIDLAERALQDTDKLIKRGLP